MKKQPILLIGFTRYSDKGIPVKANIIIDSVTGNAFYMDAGTKLSDVVAAVSGFLTVLGKRGKELNYRTQKADARNNLNQMLTTLGTYVRDKYPGDVDKWLTSGYDVQTWEINTKDPGVPEKLTGKDTSNSGEALIGYQRPQFARYFEGRHHKVGDTAPVDMTATSTTLKMKFKKLEPGQLYAFQIRSRGTKGTSDWSAPFQYRAR